MVDLDFSERLKGISCPVLLVCGEKDGANKKAAKHLEQYISGARLKMIEGAGHEVNRDKPEVLAKLLNEFYIN